MLFSLLRPAGSQIVFGNGIFSNIEQITLSPLFSGSQSSNNLIFNQAKTIIVSSCISRVGTFINNNKLTIGRPYGIPVLMLGGGGINTAPGYFTSVPYYDVTSYPLQLTYSTCNTTYTMGAYNEIGQNVDLLYYLNLNNYKGLVIPHDLKVMNNLLLNTGNIYIGNNNLTLGVSEQFPGT